MKFQFLCILVDFLLTCNVDIDLFPVQSDRFHKRFVIISTTLPLKSYRGTTFGLMQTWMYFFPTRNMFHVIWLSLRCIMEVRTARKTGFIWTVFSQWMSIVSRAQLFFLFFFFFFFPLAMIIIDRSPSAADNKISSSGFPIVFSPNNIYSSSKEKVMRINTVITKGKMLWSLIKFSQLILQENVCRSVLEICLWILVLQESTSDIVIHATRN